MRASHGSAERHRRIFWRRQLVHTSIALALLGVSLGVGMWGYEHFERDERAGRLSDSERAACSACHTKAPADHVFSRMRP